ncbi:MAG: hypothetical protein Q9176_005881 [Flavoplaca citrina]
MVTQTSSTKVPLVGFYLHSEPFPNIPKFEHVAFCWHHKALSPGKPQHVILARPGGIAPFPTIRPKDLGRLIYRQWDPLNHRDLYTIDCQGSCIITFFDYTSLCWRRVRRDFPRGPAGSIVAFPVETFAERVVTYMDSAETNPGTMILPGNLAGEKEVREAAMILLAIKHSAEEKSGAPACGLEASGSSSKTEDKQPDPQHFERIDEDVYEAAKILLAMKHSSGGLSAAPACAPEPSDSSSKANEKQLDLYPKGLADDEEKENRALTVCCYQHNLSSE